MQLDVMGESDKECLGSRFLEHEGKMKEAEDGYLGAFGNLNLTRTCGKARDRLGPQDSLCRS